MVIEEIIKRYSFDITVDSGDKWTVWDSGRFKEEFFGINISCELFCLYRIE